MDVGRQQADPPGLCVGFLFCCCKWAFSMHQGTWQLTAPDLHPSSLVTLKERFLPSSSNLENSRERFLLVCREPTVAKSVWPYD